MSMSELKKDLVDRAMQDCTRDGEVITGRTVAVRINSKYKRLSVCFTEASRYIKHNPHTEEIGMTDTGGKVWKYIGPLDPAKTLAPKRPRMNKEGLYAKR